MLDYDRVRTWPFPRLEHIYVERDVILYALGIGIGTDPVDPTQLQFTYEEGLRVLPSFATVVGHPGLWMREPATGIDWKQMLHGEQGIVIHRPLTPKGRIRCQTRVDGIVDKGAGRGALVYTSREGIDADSGERVFTATSTNFCRADGGFGGPTGPVRPVHPLPHRDPDLALDIPTLPQAALIYRLSGDLNPIHADPVTAAQLGFERPILHGLCTYGVACWAVVRSVCAAKPERLRRFEVRFSRPVLPGDVVRTEIWSESPGRAGFRCRVAARDDATVIDNGYAEFDPL